jgi:2-C-methyl-D-erythritol 4-phosphate cytidylyltransferase
MVSPHLLRPFSSRQLSLVSGDGKVLVFAVLGGKFAGSSVQVHVPTLARRVEQLPRHIDTVVFIDEPVPDGAVVATIEEMLAEFEDSAFDVLAHYVPATEAVKRVEFDAVVEGIDRSSLVSVRSPELIRRSVLEAAVESITDVAWVNPTALVASIGARVSVFGSARASRGQNAR